MQGLTIAKAFSFGAKSYRWSYNRSHFDCNMKCDYRAGGFGAEAIANIFDSPSQVLETASRRQANPMKIEFSRSGGFAAPAMRQNVEIDTKDLPESEAGELRNLINNAGIPNLASQAPSSPRPDAFHYRIKVSDEGLSHTATTSDADMPEALQPLVDWLTDRASRKSR